LQRWADWLGRLRRRGAQAAPSLEPPAASAPTPGASPTHQDGVEPRVAVVVFNPAVVPARGERLIERCGFGDPARLVRQYVADLAEVSGGYLRYAVVDWAEVPDLPRLTDGYGYSGPEWLACWERGGGWHEPQLADYAALLGALDAPRRVAAGEIDEVWLFGPPYGGFYESRLAGPGAYWCNAPPLLDLACARRFVVMGFSYERGVGEMLENFGHRIESMLAHAYRDVAPGHAWQRFSAYDLVAPGHAGCGNVHFAPNSQADYDWGNPTPVWSTCDDWLAYPALSGRRRQVDCRAWGGGDIRAHHRWWLAHLPRAAGLHAGRLANWWRYAVDPHAAD
jgi:hypothetical protein